MSRQPASAHSPNQHSADQQLPLQGSGARWLSDLRQDLRFTIRNLARSPGFALITAVTIALGVGAATTVFSIMNGLLIRPLPVAQPERLVAFQERRDGNVSTDNGYTGIEYDRYRAYSEAASVFTQLAAYKNAGFSLRIGNDAFAVSGNRVTGNYFQTLGVQPEVGSFFTRDDDATVVLSHKLWQEHFAGDRQIVGSTVYVNSRPFTVAGVAPRGFNGTLNGFVSEVYVPVMSRAQDSTDTKVAVFPIGRIRDGVTREQAEAAAKTIALRIPPHKGVRVVGARLEPLSGMSKQFRDVVVPYFSFILALAVLVLLIAAGNIVGMLLARAVARRREIAIRIAIGAARGRLIRQLLTETMLVFLAGAVGGVVIALYGTRLIGATQLPVNGTVAFDFHPDLRVLAFALLAALITGAVFGLAPALQSAKPDLIPALKAGLGSTDPQAARGRNAFVAAQIAASVLLLVAAGLFVRALQRGLTTDPGFNPVGVVVAQTDLDAHHYTGERGRAFYAQLVERLKRVPGIEAVGLANVILDGGSSIGSDAAPLEDRKKSTGTLRNIVDPGYFDALKVTIVAGRALTDADMHGKPRVAVINQYFAQKFWPNDNPVGKVFVMGSDNFQVVGVARNGKYAFMGEGPTMFSYAAFAQEYNGRMTLHVRSRLSTAETLEKIREEVRALDPNIALERAKALPDIVGFSLVPQRFGAVLIGVFGLLGLLLASIGVYGVLAFQVAQRSREIGIRLALGATVRGVLGLVLRQGARLALIGGVIGLILAVGVTRYLQSFLFGVSPLDPVTFTAVPVVLMFVALLASYIPARRAARVTPLEALRSD